MRRATLVLLTLSSTAALAATTRPSVAPPTTAPASPEQLFVPARLHTIHIRMSAKSWELMQPRRGEPAPPPKPADVPYAEGERLQPGPAGYLFAYARAEMEFDGQRVADVGVRYKGNSSYAASTTSPRRPIKLDFNRFVPSGRFAGVSSLNLNCAVFDPSEVRETIGFDLFRELDVPAPRTGHALVYLSVPGTLDRQYLGLYTLIEEVDGHFLKRHFDRDDGLLLKPERMRGLAYFGEDWTPYVTTTTYNPKGDASGADARRVIELARLINRADDAAFRDEIASRLDVDGFVRYLAVNAAMANLDSFLSTGHNYYLYVDPADGRARVVPWDMNLSFGGYTWAGSGEDLARTSITRPFADHNRLFERLMAIDKYAAAYREHLRRLADALAPAAMRRRTAAPRTILDRAAEATREANAVGSATTRPATGMRFVTPDFLTFTDRRAASIRAQLDGKEIGYHPGFRDPKLVPSHMAATVTTSLALFAAADTKGDELLTDEMVARHVDRLLFNGKGGAIDLATATAAIDRALTADLRRAMPAAAWAKWLFHHADADRDGRLTATEVMTAYRRHLTGVDRDFDGLMNTREIVEAFAGMPVP